jgi:riboflavin kinase/FMN adenylyltransferase
VKIHHALEPRTSERPLVIAIGFFDGLHRGHREIVKALLRLRRPGYRAAILTFRNHPATHLRPERVPPLLTTTEERVDLLAATGIDELYLVPFDERIAALPARRFLEEILIERLGVEALVVGRNFRFGAGRLGDADVACEVMREHRVAVEAVPALLDADERISSTRIRVALERGDLATVDRLLGQPYTLRGEVVLGHGRGHDLGFPTANLNVARGKMLPKDGVYRINARHDGQTYRGLVSIGDNPTFGPGAKTVEAWLQDFHQTIYGHELALGDFSFIREQRAFASPQELVDQMNDDATQVRFPSFPTT